MAYVLTSKAVRALSGLLRGKPGNTGVALGLSAAVPDEFALPFTVRWSAKEAAWVVWLPNLSGLVLVDGTAATITGVTAAQNLPTGWYTIDGASSASTSVYLVVTVTSSATTAALSTSAGSAATGSTVYNLLAATMATDATTGARSVKQFLASAVAIGGGSGGAYWQTGGDSTTCNGSEIQIGSVLIYEVT